MKFEIWEEGYAATGNSGGAVCLGTFEGETFAKACKAQNKTRRDPSLFDEARLTYWGCRLFDNKEEAQRSFG